MTKYGIRYFGLLSFALTLTALPVLADQYFSRAGFEKVINNWGDIRKKASDNYKDAKNFYGELLKRTTSPTDPLYTQMAQALEKMAQVRDEYVTQLEKFEDIRTEMNSLYGERKDIHSTDADWQNVVALNEKMNALVLPSNQEGKVYQQSGQAVYDLANSNHVGKYSVKDIFYKAGDIIGKFKKALKDVNGKMDQGKAYLAQNPDPKKQAVLDDLAPMIDQMTALVAEADAANLEFDKKYVDTKVETIWEGPGIPKVILLDTLKDDAGKLNDLVNKFNDRAKDLKK